MIKWLFEIDSTYYLSTIDTTHDGQAYIARILPSEFSGIQMRLDVGQDLIGSYTMSFSVGNSAGDYDSSNFEGKDCLVRLVIDGTEARKWKFSIKHAVEYYKQIKCECTDLLEPYLDGSYPETKHPKELAPSDDRDTDDEYCVPVILGTAYIPTKSVNLGGERYYILGLSDNYTVHKVHTPHDWYVQTDWSSDEYTMDISSFTKDGQDYSVLQPIIARSDPQGDFDSAGLWKSGSRFLDMPTKFEKSSTKSLTNPADWFDYVLQDMGLSASDLDLDTAKASYTTDGIEYNGGWWEKKERETVLSNLLKQCDSFFSFSDKITLNRFSTTSVMTVDNVIDGSFRASKLSTSDNDSGKLHATASTDKPMDIYSAREVVSTYSGGTKDKVSNEVFQADFLAGQTIAAQHAARLFFQKRYEQKTKIDFAIDFITLTDKSIVPGQVATVNKALYGGTHAMIMTDISIDPDLRVDISGVTLTNEITEWGDDIFTEIEISEDDGAYWDSGWVIPEPFVQTPTLTVEGYPNDVPDYPTLTGSSFRIFNAKGEADHDMSDWICLRDGTEIWSSKNDTTNLTTIEQGNKVKPGVVKWKYRQHDSNYGWSDYAVVTLGIDGDPYPEEGENIGMPMGGGYYACSMEDKDGNTFALILSGAVGDGFHRNVDEFGIPIVEADPRDGKPFWDPMAYGVPPFTNPRTATLQDGVYNSVGADDSGDGEYNTDQATAYIQSNYDDFASHGIFSFVESYMWKTDFDDWYIPAPDEWQLIIDCILQGNSPGADPTAAGVPEKLHKFFEGGEESLSATTYWSSQESDSNNAIAINLSDGTSTTADKASLYGVRAVRRMGIATRVKTPELTVEGYPDSIPTNPTLTASAFEVWGTPADASHDMSDWQVLQSTSAEPGAGSVFFESLSDTTNLTSITQTTDLESGYYYTWRHRQHCAVYGWSEWVEVTTKDVIDDPTTTKGLVQVLDSVPTDDAVVYWVDTRTGRTFARYWDGESTQWFETVGGIN